MGKTINKSVSTPQSNTVGEYKNIKLDQDKNHVIDADRPGLIIASCNLFRKTPEATAARIVECWNGYDELKSRIGWWEKHSVQDGKDHAKMLADIEALKEALTTIIELKKESGMSQPYIDQIMKIASEAISKHSVKYTKPGETINK